MKKNLNVLRIVELILAFIGLISIIISMFQDGNNIFLIIGLCCVNINAILLLISNLKKKK
ncbi:MAG TPA: hypothetical protein PLV83_00335 [Bacilli bacterium]|nr:hypothetical protein [Bacilli bacterium]